MSDLWIPGGLRINVEQVGIALVTLQFLWYVFAHLQLLQFINDHTPN